MTITLRTLDGHAWLTARFPGCIPVQVHAATTADAVACMRSILADEKRKACAAFDDIDAALVDLNARAVAPADPAA